MLFGLLDPSTIGIFGQTLPSNSKRPIKCVFISNLSCKARPLNVDLNSPKTFFIHFLLVLISVVDVLTLFMILFSSFCSK